MSDKSKACGGGKKMGAVWGDMPASAFLQNSFLFRSLDEEGRELVMRTGRQIEFEDGEMLIAEGGVGDMFYIIRSGNVDVFTSRDGAEISLARLGHGACVGEVALLTGSCRTASVRAAGKVCAVGFSAKDISGILDSYPKVREILHNLVQERAEDAIEKLFRGR